MQVAVISDLHLGTGGSADGFGHDDFDFLRFLTFLERSFERIVLLGDIYETLTSWRPGSAHAALKAARAAHPEIAQRFGRGPYHYLHGNHDWVAGTAEKVPEEIVLEDHGVRLWFAHGHQGDPFVQRARWLSELGVWLGGILRRLGMHGVYQALGTIGKPKLYPFAEQLIAAARTADLPQVVASGFLARIEVSAFETWAVEGARLRNANVVITGHTHQALRTEHGNEVFLNSGSCTGGQFSFLSLDTKTADYRVHDRW